MSATRTFNVPGISCGHCKAAIEEEVGQLDDVAEVVVDIDLRTVTITGDAEDATIAATLEEIGYELAEDPA